MATKSGFGFYDDYSGFAQEPEPKPALPEPTKKVVPTNDESNTDPYQSTVEAVFGKASPKPTAAVPRNINIPINIPIPFTRGKRIKPGLFLSGPRMESAVRGMSDYIKESDYKPTTPGASFLHGLASGFVGSAGAQVAKRDKDLAERKKAWEEDQKNRADFLQKLREATITKGDKETPGWTKVTSDNIDAINEQLVATGRRAIPVDESGTPAIGYVKTDDVYTDVSKGDNSGMYVLHTPQEIANFKKAHPDLADKMYVEPDGSVRVPVAAAYREPQPVLSPGALQFAVESMGATGQLPSGLQRNPRMAAQVYDQLSKRGFTGANIAVAQATFRAKATSLTQLQRMSANADAFIDTAHANTEILKKALLKLPSSNIMIVNGVVRTLGRLAGDPDIAAFNTALEVLRPEFSRILTSPNLTGGLTVAQKQEINAIIDGNFSKSQMIAALNILNQDASNRSLMYKLAMQSMQNEIAAGANIPLVNDNPELDFIPATNTEEPGIWQRQHPGQPVPGVPAQTGGSGSSNLQEMLGTGGNK